MIIRLIIAFLVGGGICVIGQLLLDFKKLHPAVILSGFVVAGAVLSFFGLYQPFIDFAGAGATVPIIGFGHILFDGVKQAVDTDGLIGVLTGGLTASAGGITGALIFGVVVALLFKAKDQS